MSHTFSQVDVFTDELTLGNPVAVVHDADDLTDEQMAAVARWTNLSETTFLLRPTTDAADYRLRIFTTGGELPFAGHPTLGSARAWLECGGTPAAGRTPGTLVQECALGLVTLRTEPRLAFAAPDRLRAEPLSAADVADVVQGLHLDPADVVDARWCDNGPGWAGLLLRDADAVLSVDLSRPTFGRIDKIGLVGPYADAAAGTPAFEVRAFYDGFEDPVTGSLNAAVAQWLLETDQAPPAYVASQGTAMQRRGRVHVERDGHDVWVGGDTVVGVTGTISL